MNAHALIRMSAAMLVVACAGAGEMPASRSLFTRCDEALATSEFAGLARVIPEALRESGRCLRLTDGEFVILRPAMSGPGNPFLYCDVRRAAPSCEPEPFFAYDMEVAREFMGGKGKRFLLWKTYQYRQGVYHSGYGIFSLVPKTVEPRGFYIYGLAGGAIFRGEDTDQDPCRGLGNEASEIIGFDVRGEGTSAVEIRFTERAVDCRTKGETLRELLYRPRNGVFERVR